MKQFLKRLSACAVSLAAAVVVLVMPASAAVTLPALPADQCVVDDANVLSDETAAYIDQLNGQLEANCSGAQIGVLTVQYTGSATTEEYALEAFNAWEIGSSSENNGVLLLLVMESPLYTDGDYYLTYGDGFRNTTIDRQASTLSQTMEDSFAARDYDTAVRTCAAAVADTIADIYGVSLDGAGGGSAPQQEESWLVRILNAVILVFLVGLLLVVVFIVMIAPIGRGLGLMWGPFLWGYHPGPRPPRPPRGPHNPPPHNHWNDRGPRPPRGGGSSHGGGRGR